MCGFARFFDIVNGFLIDAVAHWCVVQGPYAHAALTDVVNLAEIIRPRLETAPAYARLSLMVWILKREVRAFGGCLGMYRR